jgi:hypothetical protein
MNRRQFFQKSAAVAALCADGMLPSLLEAQSPAAPLPGGAEAAAVAAINPPAGVRVAGILMIPVVGGKYKVWTKRLGSGQTKVLLLHGGRAMTHSYLEAMESFLPDAGIEMYYYDQLGCGNSDIRTVTWYIHFVAGTRNAPAAIQRLEPIHDPRDILGDGQITASQLFQCAQAVLSVIDRLKMVTTQELSQLVRIDSITFTTVFQQGILARITHHDFADARLQQVV